ncbi:beta-1,3-glucanase precursor [Immersiella caudata]|uniref:Beta-1,3-glucanase n=1 Tax=Immersiella caudata TaxID=314043 RepID=A0AA39WYZ0_9PEZI|nr:beta-1,3-glucanase precursor [Immersiella caudata]
MVGLSLLLAIASATLLFGRVTARPAELASRDPPGGSGNTNFWYAKMDRSTRELRGYTPDIGDDNYPVYVEVFPGQGGQGIQDAISGKGSGNHARPGTWLVSQPRVVFLHSGVYNVNKTIFMNTDTILMGDATSVSLFAPESETNTTLLSTDNDALGGVTENCFTVALKHIILDLTSVPNRDEEMAALGWNVAQGSHLQNIVIKLPKVTDSKGHAGIVVGRGSTLAIADVRIEDGMYGIVWNVQQQAVLKNIHFYGNQVGLYVVTADAINIVNSAFEEVGTCVVQIETGPWISIIDGQSINSGLTLDTQLTPSILIENFKKDTLDDLLHGPYDYTLPWQSNLDRFTYANTVGENPKYTTINGTWARPDYLAPGGDNYPSPAAPSYAGKLVSDFVNVKDRSQNGGYTVKGDNSADDAAALNSVLVYAVDNNKIAYFPFGKYRVKSTVVVPIGSRIVGEAWATISGAGSFFSNTSDPKPVVQVGNPNDVGRVEISDMHFTVSEVLPGAILLQVHAAGENPGDVAIWNSLITVGGTRGTKIPETCVDPNAPCQAAFMGIHLAPTSSAYLENVWNWVADHIPEEIAGGSNIAAGRGVLVESTKGTWLQAVGSEHWWLYQLQFLHPEGVFVSMLQSETNYGQGDNASVMAPAPWTADSKWSDPDFSWCGETEGRCRMGVATLFNGGKDIYTYCSASWVFFAGPRKQACDFRDRFSCQKYMHYIKKTPENLNAFGMMSKSTYATLRLENGTELLSKEWLGGWTMSGGSVGRYTV